MYRTIPLINNEFVSYDIKQAVVLHLRCMISLENPLSIQPPLYG